MAAQKRPAQTHRARRSPPPPPKPPAIVGIQPRAVSRRPSAQMSTLSPPRAASQVRREPDPRQSAIAAKPRAPTPAPDSTSAKLLVIASLMSLVVVVLSLAVLSKTTGVVNIQTTEPVHIQTVPAQNAAPPTAAKDTPLPQPPADLMLMLDVEPKDASLVVHPTDEGFEVKVAAKGYQPETRTIEKGVTGRIAVKLEPAPPPAPAPKKEAPPAKKKAKKRARKRAVAEKSGPRPDAEVFLTGSDL